MESPALRTLLGRARRPGLAWETCSRWVAPAAILAVVLAGVRAGDRAAPAAAQDTVPGAAAHPCVGSWFAELDVPPGVPRQRALIAFLADGTVVETLPGVVPSIFPDGPGTIANSTGLGTWEATGDDACAFTFVDLGAGPDGSLYTIETFRGEAEVAAAGDALGAALEFDTIDGDGNILEEDVMTTVRGTRITLAPIGSVATPLGATEAGTPSP